MSSFEKMFLVPPHLMPKVKKCLQRAAAAEPSSSNSSVPAAAAAAAVASPTGACSCESRLTRLETLCRRSSRSRPRASSPVGAAARRTPNKRKSTGSTGPTGPTGPKSKAKVKVVNPTKQLKPASSHRNKNGVASLRRMDPGRGLSSSVLVLPGTLKRTMGISAQDSGTPRGGKRRRSLLSSVARAGADGCRVRRRHGVAAAAVMKRKRDTIEQTAGPSLKKFRPHAKLSQSMKSYRKHRLQQKKKTTGALLTTLGSGRKRKGEPLIDEGVPAKHRKLDESRSEERVTLTPWEGRGKKRKGETLQEPWPQRRKLDYTLGQLKKNQSVLQSNLKKKPPPRVQTSQRILPKKPFPPTLDAPPPGKAFLDLVKGIMQRATLHQVNVGPGMKRKTTEEGSGQEEKRIKLGEANSLKRKVQEWEELLSPLVKKKRSRKSEE